MAIRRKKSGVMCLALKFAPSSETVYKFQGRLRMIQELRRIYFQRKRGTGTYEDSRLIQDLWSGRVGRLHPFGTLENAVERLRATSAMVSL